MGKSDANIHVLKNNKIGIVGGTFDPVHYGHLFIAQTALDELNLNKVLFIPTGKPPHKREKLITEAYRRIDMLKLAIEGNPKFDISTTEIVREKTSYTIDTIKELQQYYNKKTKFYFIVGSDAFIKIEAWKEYKNLLGLTKFVVMARQIFKDQLLDEKIKLLTEEYNADITRLEIPILDISSTDIRRRIREGRSIKYLLPGDVEAYIFNYGLYTD
ncbi:MAG TPA: nicotinate-nucleotide adenylyltransferase [Oscillospiraceae bacterium]|nr:nicotinate-nucleotide adenylyltransferase [Oscillospiraceae bacterium]